MSADAGVEARVDLKANAATVTQRREIGELFDEYGELQLWDNDDGWPGPIADKSAVTVTINGTEFESHPVNCPECDEQVDAQVVLLDRECPSWGVDYGVFFPDSHDPEAADIACPFDGRAEVREA